jgi:hypothetical protein
MESDPLQQLRDVHLPTDPGWWPPAPGWWLLAALLLAALVWLLIRALAAYRIRAPLREARALLKELLNAHTRGDISDSEYLHQGNEILKRVLVRGYGRYEYAPLAGQAWLRALDELSGTNHFTCGCGEVLGDARFSARPTVDVRALSRELELLLSKVKP